MPKHGTWCSLPARPVVVAIPVKDEAKEIEPCLLALAAQQVTAIDAIVLCLNNCSDASADVVRAMEPRLPFALHMIAVQLPEALACAGRARRIAMERAATLAGANGVLLTTDADARVRSGLDRGQSRRDCRGSGGRRWPGGDRTRRCETHSCQSSCD